MVANNFIHTIANAGTYFGGVDLNIDASRNSAIYGASSTVTPLSQSTLMLIKY